MPKSAKKRKEKVADFSVSILSVFSGHSTNMFCGNRKPN